MAVRRSAIIHINTTVMKQILIIICVLAFARISFAQKAGLYNNQGGLFIAAGTQVLINGNFINEAGSSLKNSGELTISGNLTNKATMAASEGGNLLLVGNSTQTIAGILTGWANLTVNNPAGILSTAPLKVNGQVDFMSGILTNMDPANAIIFANTASVSGVFPPSDASHVDGYVIKEGEGTFTFPVGDDQTYQPVAVDLSENAQGIIAKYEVGSAGEGPFTGLGSGGTPLLTYNPFEYWTLRPLTSATGSVTVFWDNYKNIGIANVADLTVAHFTNNSWQNEGANNTAGGVTVGSVTSNVISSWSPFTLGSINIASPLPVGMIQFTGKITDNQAQLSWQVADLTNFSHFEIERSIDAIHYEKIGTVQYVVEPKAQLNYQFTDKAVLAPSGMRYYRLRLLDKNGSYSLSKVVSLNFNDSSPLQVIVYPNPSKDKFTLKIDGAGTIAIDMVITSVDGRQVMNRKVNLIGGSAIVDTRKLSAGIYFLSTKLNGRTKVIKFIKK